MGCGILAMSLTSRVLGLFSTTETTVPDSPPVASYSKPTNTGDHAFHATGQIRAGSGHVQTTPLEDEEEPRPPYLRVRCEIRQTGNTHGVTNARDVRGNLLSQADMNCFL